MILVKYLLPLCILLCGTNGLSQKEELGKVDVSLKVTKYGDQNLFVKHTKPFIAALTEKEFSDFRKIGLEMVGSKRFVVGGTAAQFNLPEDEWVLVSGLAAAGEIFTITDAKKLNLPRSDNKKIELHLSQYIADMSFDMTDVADEWELGIKDRKSVSIRYWFSLTARNIENDDVQFRVPESAFSGNRENFTYFRAFCWPKGKYSITLQVHPSSNFKGAKSVIFQKTIKIQSTKSDAALGFKILKQDMKKNRLAYPNDPKNRKGI